MINNLHNFPAKKYKEDFPIFNNKIYGKDLIYLDTAASAQKPKCVIDSISKSTEAASIT